MIIGTKTVWDNVLLYCVLVGRRKEGKLIRRRVTSREIWRMRNRLEKELAKYDLGSTCIRMFEAVGKGSSWKRERTSLLLCIVDRDDGVLADSIFVEQASEFCDALDQDQVWVTKERIERFIAVRRIT